MDPRRPSAGKGGQIRSSREEGWVDETINKGKKEGKKINDENLDKNLLHIACFGIPPPWMCGTGRGGKGQMSKVRGDLQNPNDAS
jgi:hypothetical protein